jgi:phosphatidate cytidylyltransferase
MTQSHWQVLLIYLSFMIIATVLALARRWRRPGNADESVWRKYPTYILINLTFLAASWLSSRWPVLTLLLTLLGGLAAWELTRALAPQAHWLAWVAAGLIGVAGLLKSEHWWRLWWAVMLALLAFIMLAKQRNEAGRWLLALAGSGVYLPACLAAYLWIQRGDSSGFRAVFLYLVIAANDAFAQITGQLFGARPLAPRLSPAKTVEGALGGIIFASLMGAALSTTTGWSVLTGAGFGLVLGVAGLGGDLLASAWKRALGLKNFSALLGAQGGVLDRFDGLIFAAPVFYLLVT